MSDEKQKLSERINDEVKLWLGPGPNPKMVDIIVAGMAFADRAEELEAAKALAERRLAVLESEADHD